MLNIDSQAEKALTAYAWPGNVRELSNTLERVLSYLEGNTIYLCDLPFYLYRNSKGLEREGRAGLKTVQRSAEREAIRYALESSGYNKAKAAQLLGIHRSVLYKKMKKYNIPLNSP
jgi:transcriptional regulator with PAS, ATPase and Fis domain